MQAGDRETEGWVYLCKVAQSREFSCTLFGAKLITEYSFCSLHSDDSESAISIQSLDLCVRKLLATVSSAALVEHTKAGGFENGPFLSESLEFFVLDLKEL
jgi:hypothetical protein